MVPPSLCKQEEVIGERTVGEDGAELAVGRAGLVLGVQGRLTHGGGGRTARGSCCRDPKAGLGEPFHPDDPGVRSHQQLSPSHEDTFPLPLVEARPEPLPAGVSLVG